MTKKGLYANINAKRKAGSKEKMRKVGAKGAPTTANFKRAAKTAKKPQDKLWYYKVIKKNQMQTKMAR